MSAGRRVLTLPYVVAFITMSRPNPQRLGTAEEITVAATVWAKDVDDAMAEVRRLCEAEGREVKGFLDVTVPITSFGHQQIPLARELILNDEKCEMKVGDLDSSSGNGGERR